MTEDNILEPYVIVISSPDHYIQAFFIINEWVIGNIQRVPFVLTAFRCIFNVISKGILGFLFHVISYRA